VYAQRLRGWLRENDLISEVILPAVTLRIGGAAPESNASG
jgi:hypothetical protein